MSVNMKNIPSSNRAGLIHNCLFSFDGMMMWRWDWNLGPHSKSAGQTNRLNNWLQISKLDFYLQLSFDEPSLIFMLTDLLIRFVDPDFDILPMKSNIQN